MTKIILIRHGQANSSATDEAGYDRLSDLGHRQAAWLGDYFRATGQRVDHFYCGTLRRHRETAAGMALDHPVKEDARLNELRYFDMAHALREQTDEPLPTGPGDFAAHIPKVLAAWHKGDLDHAHLPYGDFATQMADVVAEAAQVGGTHVFVTSGGVIGMMIARILGLPPAGYADVLLPIHNTSLHHFEVIHGSTKLMGYNAIPHLDDPDRAQARTYV